MRGDVTNPEQHTSNPPGRAAGRPVVRAHRAGTAKYVLEAEGHLGTWFTRQFAYKGGDGRWVPYWYEEGKTWHVWEGDRDQETPPLASFERMGEVKEYVASLIQERATGG